MSSVSPPARSRARPADAGERLKVFGSIWRSAVSTSSESAPSPVTEPAHPTTPESAMPDHPASREPELLTINEAAELLRASVATLRYWRLGTGPRSFRLGRRVLYCYDDLQAWVEAQL